MSALPPRPSDLVDPSLVYKIGEVADRVSDLSERGHPNDLLVTYETMKIAELSSIGRTISLRYGWHQSPFGDCLIIVTPSAICGLAFAKKPNREAALADLTDHLGEVQLIADQAAITLYADRVFHRESGNLPVLLCGTQFQIRVWKALLHIPAGTVVSYSQLANSLGIPNSARAVGQACAANKVAWLIPCHRVVRANSTLGAYRWGPGYKHVILAWEAAQAAVVHE